MTKIAVWNGEGTTALEAHKSLELNNGTWAVVRTAATWVVFVSQVDEEEQNRLG